MGGEIGVKIGGVKSRHPCLARLSTSDDRVEDRRRGIGGTQVPEPQSPRSRSRVAQWDRGAGANVRQSYRTLTAENRWCEVSPPVSQIGFGSYVPLALAFLGLPSG
jgi:hypothetical protein